MTWRLQFTGDGAGRDHEGFYWIRGRVDDVVNVSGHRLSTAEIEAALIEHQAVAESAVVGVHDELTGQAVNAFVSLKNGNDVTDALRKELALQVRKSIGPFAAPKAIYVVPDLPKTRSGKIMRRVLRKILAGEEDQLGDTSTVCPLPCPFCTQSYLTNWLPAVRPERGEQDSQSCARCEKEMSDEFKAEWLALFCKSFELYLFLASEGRMCSDVHVLCTCSHCDCRPDAMARKQNNMNINDKPMTLEQTLNARHQSARGAAKSRKRLRS